MVLAWRTMMRLAALAALIAAVVFAARAQDAEVDPTEIDRLWNAARQANASEPFARQEIFYRAFAEQVLPYLHDFDDFITTLKDENATACQGDLLCRAHIVPRFQIEQPPTAIDFVRYVRDTTCLGFLPSHQRTFVELLEAALVSSMVDVHDLLNEPNDGARTRELWVMAQISSIRDSNGDPIATRYKFPRVYELIDQARHGDTKWERGWPTFIEPELLADAEKVCRSAYKP